MAFQLTIGISVEVAADLVLALKFDALLADLLRVVIATV
jgi:hypothetical protein